MSAKLLWITPDVENMIINIARVSTPTNRENVETAPKLTGYLLRKGHFSPFEMGNMCIELTGISRAISAQICRHRSFTFQEYSQRYAQVDRPKVPKQRRQDTKNRQSSHDDLGIELEEKYDKIVQKHFDEKYEIYLAMLADGFSKETARMILPMCSETTLIINGTIRSWLHYLKARCAEETQFEHREVANLCAAIFKQQMPIIYAAYFEAEQ